MSAGTPLALRPYLVIAGASVLAGASAPLDQGAVVELKATGPISSALVVTTGGDNKGCYEHLAVVGTGQVHFGRDAGANWCRQEIAVQAQDYGMVLDTQPVWTSGVTKVDLPPRVVLKLNLWVPSGVTWVADGAKVQVELADKLLNHSRAGITLSPSDRGMQNYSTVDAAVIGAGCPAVENLVKSDATKGLYDPAAINVYYVAAITAGGAWGAEGYDCFEWGAPNVIYMSYDALDNVLAHELGHALGLQYGNGHVNGLRGFAESNLMYRWLPPNVAILQDHWTAGQVYRMNVDTRSVLNQLVGVGTGAKAFRTGVRWVCQEDPEATVPCPPLAYEGP